MKICTFYEGIWLCESGSLTKEQWSQVRFCRYLYGGDQMLNKLSFMRMLWIFTVMSSIFVFVMGGTSMFFLNQTNREFSNVADVQLPAVRNMTLADMYHDGMRAIVMGALYESSQGAGPSEIGKFEIEIEEMAGKFEITLNDLQGIGLKTATKEAIQEAIPEVKLYSESARSTISDLKQKGLEAGKAHLAEFNRHFSSLEEKLEKLGGLIEADAKSLKNSGDVYEKQNFISTILFAILSVVLGALVMRKLRSTMIEFTSDIETVSGGVGVASSELAKASEEMANSATKAAAAIQETVASLEEMNAAVKHNTDHAGQAQKVSNLSKVTAESGNDDMKKLIQSISEISEASQKMNSIISAIDDIAFQTNLLALNAAVEAARAGEQGKGFAVVAEAVRSLAQRSAVAAKDISNIIRENETKINFGAEVAAKGGSVLNEIVGSVLKVATLNDEIAVSSRQQSEGINQISAAMNSLDESSQRNAAISEEVSASCGALKSQSDRMSESLVSFRARIFGESA